MKVIVKNLTFAYKKKDFHKNDALSNINFTIESGDCVILLGRNGSGKSTIIKLLDKLLDKYEGEIYLGDDELRTLSQSEVARRVAYVEQKILLNDMSVFDAVLLGRIPYFANSTRKCDLEVVSQTIKDLDLSSISLKNVNEISSGELQKVGIARAFAQEPQLLMFDEPLNNLDLKAQADFIDLLKKVKDKHITSIVSMHDINASMLFGTKFIVLKEGKLAYFGDKSIITEEMIKDVYGVDVIIDHNHIHIKGGFYEEEHTHHHH